MKNCYTALPKGYVKVGEADSTGGTKYGRWLNVFSILIMIVAVYIIYSLRFGTSEDNVSLVGFWASRIHLLFFLFVFVVSLLCHSLLHGVMYRFMTGQDFKISAGGNLVCCSLPGVYMKRKAAVTALLAPFVLFSVIFIIAMSCTQGYLALAFVFAFAIHTGCCAGDFYIVFQLLFKYKGDVLMHEGGMKQAFYIYSAKAAEAQEEDEE